MKRQYKQTSLLLTSSMALICGVAISYKLQIHGPWYLLSLMPLTWFLKQRSIVTVILLILTCLCIGQLRGSDFIIKKQAYSNLYGHKLDITVIAMNDGSYGSLSQFSFDGGNARLPNGQKLVGKIQVSGFGTNAVFQNDQVEVVGKLMPSSGAYQGRISFASLTVISHHPSLVADIRRKFSAGMQSALPEPLASFAMGLLIGQRSTLPAEVKQNLLMVGLTHIIAVSGYNLTIMLGASQRLAGKRSKRLTTILSFTLMGLFVLMTGASASIVRAAIVSTLSIAAGYFGRNFKPLNLIFFAAAITAWANPFYIWSDVSWYLSFLAFFGVLVLAPLLVKRFRPKWQTSVLIMVAIESLCAEIMTIPYVLHVFGQMSLIGLPANVLVVTLIPLAMLLCLIAGLAGMLAINFVGWLAWPAILILTYMLDIAQLLASLPHGFLQQIRLSVPQMLSIYLVVITITVLLYTKTNIAPYDKITDRIAINEGASK